MKKLLIIPILLSFTQIIYSQNYIDVMRYSETFPMGNARFTGMSGAFGALGANSSGISVNPAGAAVFKSDIIEITPAFMYSKTQNYYLNSYNSSFTNTLAIPNFAIVFTKDLEENDFMARGITFGFSANRQNNFDENINYISANNTSSLTDDFLRNANQNNFAWNYTQLAYNTYAIDYDSTSGTYFSDFRDHITGTETYKYGQTQEINMNKSGKMKEFAYSVAVDFADKVFVGGSLNFNRFTYSETFSIKETDKTNEYAYLNNFTYRTNLDVDGIGLGANIGVIVKPVEFLRFGFAAHSPVELFSNENYTAGVYSNYDQLINDSYSFSSSEDSEFEYSIRKPGKTVTSLALVYKNIAIVDVDVENINYKYGQITSDSESFINENNEIRTSLKNVNNIKVGGEIKFGPYSFRGGYAVYENPYENKLENVQYYRQDLSGGIGISNDDFYFDFSWVKSKTNKEFSLYKDYSGNSVNAKTNTYQDNIFVTLGFKF